MIRKQTPEEQIAKMQHLIKFGVNEDTTRASVPVVEFKKKAANGKTYGIIRDATKYYIMEAPEKDTEILAEDFDYIGGYNNRKENEYSSYSKASNALDLQIMAINEVVDKKDRVQIEKPVVKAEWENNITEGMRKEIDRFKTLTENINSILTEGEIGKSAGSVPSEHTLPEAPAKNPSDKKVNAPFTQSGVAKGDKDFKVEEHNHETAGSPFDKDGKSSVEKNMRSDKKPRIKTDAEYLTNEKTYEPDDNIASKKPSGGKVVRVNENNGKIRLKLTEEQVLAWNRDNENYMDKSHGTKIGSSDPFDDELGKESNQTEAPTEPIREGNGSSVVYDHPNDQNKPTPGTRDVETEDGDPFIEIVTESDEIDIDDVAGFDEDYDDVPFPEVEDDIYDEEDWENSPNTKFDRDYSDFEDRLEREQNPNYEIELDNDPYGDDADDLLITPDMYDIDYDDDESSHTYGHGDERVDFDDELDESRRARRLSEVRLNDFGKHPAYRKRPMTLPPNKEVAINGAREWDDESVQGEEPFGKKIGDSAPFDEIVDSVMESYKRKFYRRNKKKH